MLAVVIGSVTRIIYDLQFWMTPVKEEVRYPLVLVCDEAHIYRMICLKLKQLKRSL